MTQKRVPAAGRLPSHAYTPVVAFLSIASAWHFPRAVCDLLNEGGCGGCRESRINHQLKGNAMNVKTNVKVGALRIVGKPVH